MHGHGDSQMPAADAPFSLTQLVGDAVELLDLLGCACAHVVGNSARGYGVQKLAINYPALVRTLAL
jgi:3-oxoadipate enol-lactonase